MQKENEIKEAIDQLDRVVSISGVLHVLRKLGVSVTFHTNNQMEMRKEFPGHCYDPHITSTHVFDAKFGEEFSLEAHTGGYLLHVMQEHSLNIATQMLRRFVK